VLFCNERPNLSLKLFQFSDALPKYIVTSLYSHRQNTLKLRLAIIPVLK